MKNILNKILFHIFLHKTKIQDHNCKDCSSQKQCHDKFCETRGKHRCFYVNTDPYFYSWRFFIWNFQNFCEDKNISLLHKLK
jgi:hypothetical protein